MQWQIKSRITCWKIKAKELLSDTVLNWRTVYLFGMKRNHKTVAIIFSVYDIKNHHKVFITCNTYQTLKIWKMCCQRVDLKTWSLVSIQWLSIFCFAVMKQGNRNMLAADITSGSCIMYVGIPDELCLYTWKKVVWHLWVTCSVINDIRQPS